jgi:protoporphyrinogen oxidase
MASVVVVGGGLAGLACAWRLARAGHAVEVLEREAEPGGSARAEDRFGFRVERGPQLALARDANLRALLASLGVEAALVPVPEPALGILRDGRIEPCDPRSPARLFASLGLGARASLGCLRLALEVARRRRLLDPTRPERAAPLDGAPAGERLRRIAGEEAWRELVAPALAAATGITPGTLSEAAALLALRRAFAGGAPRRLAGGVGRLTSELAARVAVRTGCEVLRVETETDGARVRYRGSGGPRSAFADAAVVAVGGEAVAALCPKLTPAERGFFESLAYAPRVAVRLLLDLVPAGVPALLLAPETAGPGPVSAELDTEPAPPGSALLLLRFDETSARLLLAAPDAEVVGHALRALAPTPLARLEVAHAQVERAARGALRLAPGSLRRLAAFASRFERSPRLAFASDAACPVPGLEGSVTRGLRAATEVARALG